MEYIFIAVLAMLSNVGNTFCNKLGSNKASSLTSSAIKSTFMTAFMFLIVGMLNHLGNIATLTINHWAMIGVCGILTTSNWVFYFLALKRASLNVFSPFNETSELSFTNILFLIFCFNSVTNSGSGVSTILYVSSLIVLLGVLIFMIANKTINIGGSRTFIIFGVISALSYAGNNLVVKLFLNSVEADVVTLFQMCIVMVATTVMMLAKKAHKEFASLSWKNFLIFFVGAIFNALAYLFRYQAYSYDNCNPALVNVIITLAFILISIVSLIVNHKKQTKNTIFINSLIISLVTIGAILNFLSSLF